VSIWSEPTISPIFPQKFIQLSYFYSTLPPTIYFLVTWDEYFFLLLKQSIKCSLTLTNLLLWSSKALNSFYPQKQTKKEVCYPLSHTETTAVDLYSTSTCTLYVHYIHGILWQISSYVQCGVHNLDRGENRPMRKGNSKESYVSTFIIGTEIHRSKSKVHTLVSQQ
jgi:hypothetical protein